MNKLRYILHIPNNVEKDMGDLYSLILILDVGTDNYAITDDN